MHSTETETRKGNDLQEENEIQVMGKQKGNDLQEKNEIQVMGEQGRP